jgi:glycosyltransferase involved in cell wall biosynthesis
MRLLAYTDAPELGGGDLSLAHLLARLDPSVAVTVMGVQPPIVERIAAARPGTATRVVPSQRSGHDVRALLGHVHAVRDIAPDIVHANLASPWSCQYGIAAAEILRRPRVVAVYQLPVPPISKAQWRAKRLTVRGVHRHVGVGERTSREVEALVGLEPRERVNQGPVVGAFGRLEEQKGFDVLIRAVADLDGASLVLVGDGSERARLEDLARRVGVADRITWTGWQDDPRAYLPTFDVLAFPSRFEGFPLAILEALLGRSAVVASDVGSVGEVVVDGETGLLVPRDDPRALARAIRRLLDDAELRVRVGDAGRRLVLDRFTAEHMTRSFESLYDELLNR